MKNKSDVIYIHPKKRIISQRKNYFYLIFTGVFFLIIGLLSDSLSNNLVGLMVIMTSPVIF